MSSRLSFLLPALSFAVLLRHPSPTFGQLNTPCSPGFYSDTGTSPCSRCGPGTYTKESGSTTCTLAPPGTFVFAPDSVEFCPIGTISGSGASYCTPCPGGTYGSAELTACIDCPPGTYSELGYSGVCTVCPVGTYNSEAAARRCTPCPPGTACPSEEMRSYHECAPGTFSPVVGGTTCLACPKGSFSGMAGATSCCPCCSGFYADNVGQPACRPCPTSGSYSPAGATDHSQCNSGLTGGATECTMPGPYSCPFLGGVDPSPSSGSTCSDADGPSPSQGPSANAANAPARRHWQLPRRPDCPTAHRSCPVYELSSQAGPARRSHGVVAAGRRAVVKGYECVDVENDARSCGGCIGPPPTLARGSPTHDSVEDDSARGRDCGTIPFVNGVVCRNASCVIESCVGGFVPSTDGVYCVSAFSVHAAKRGAADASGL